MNEDDAINHFCLISSSLKEARESVLKKHGITESGLKKLEEDAYTLMGNSELIENDIWTLQKIYDKPVHTVVTQGKPTWKKKLKFTLKGK
jgi:hypothetical protein